MGRLWFPLPFSHQGVELHPPLFSDNQQNIAILQHPKATELKSSEKLYVFMSSDVSYNSISSNLISTFFRVLILTHFPIWAPLYPPRPDPPIFTSPRCFCFKLGSKYETCPFRVVDGTATTPGGEGQPR